MNDMTILSSAALIVGQGPRWRIKGCLVQGKSHGVANIWLAFMVGPTRVAMMGFELIRR